MTKQIYIGTMSGTSVDALDLVLVEFVDKEFTLLDYQEYDYDQVTRDKIFKAINDETTTKEICELNIELANFYAANIDSILKKNGLTADDVIAIGSHGQTIYHLPKPNAEETKSTLQIVDGSVIAQLTGIDTVSDFRTAHIGAGGEGAPLVPFGEFKLFNSDKEGYNRIWQNIGGISNSTLLTKNYEETISFDNGPGNMIIDYFAEALFNLKYDTNGETASKGTINEKLLNILLDDPYYTKELPKTTGREKYGKDFCENILSTYDIDKHDLLRTMTYFTAKVISDSYKRYLIKEGEKYEVFVSGGGSYNNTLINDMKNEFIDNDNVEVYIAEDIDIDSGAKEAVIFAYFAHRTINRKHSAVINGKKVILGKVSYK